MTYTEKQEAYKKAVVDAFLQMQLGSQQGWLVSPTRAMLKKQCLELVERRPDRRDLATLHEFLEMGEEDTNYSLAIKKKGAEGFKTMEKFLKNTNINTAPKNIELLACLVGFQDRPYPEFKKLEQFRPVVPPGESRNAIDSQREQAETIVGEEERKDFINQDQERIEMVFTEKETFVPISGVDNTSQTADKKNIDKPAPLDAKRLGLWWPWLSAACLLILGALVFWSLSAPGCMYWDNDHYVATSCSLQRLDTPTIAMDRSKLRGFRRIKNVDTLTRYAVGRLWYTHVADSIEVYSAAGFHPLYPDKQLKKVSDYVVNHLHNRK